MLSCVGVGLGDKVEISRNVSVSPHNHGMGLAPVPYLFGTSSRSSTGRAADL